MADGYETYHVEAFPVEERAVTDLGVIYLTPKGTNQPPSEMGQIAVVLDWGAKPADLDLHATAPLLTVTRGSTSLPMNLTSILAVAETIPRP